MRYTSFNCFHPDRVLSLSLVELSGSCHHDGCIDMCQNQTTDIPRNETKMPVSPPPNPTPQELSLCLNESVAPLQPADSAKQDEWMNGWYFHNTHFFAKWRQHRLQGHFNWPFSAPITLWPVKKSDIYCHRLLHKELNRDRGCQGGGVKDWKTRGPSLLMVMNEWIITRFGKGLCLHTGRAPWMTWVIAQLPCSTCAHPLGWGFTQ